MLKGFDAKGKEFTLKVGDTVKGLTGSGNVAAYNPTFSVYTTRNENDYRWGRKSFAAAAAGCPAKSGPTESVRCKNQPLCGDESKSG